MPLNIEFKARCEAPDRVRDVLRKKNARLAGIDNQTDTYFDVPSGRLKLRDGNVERNLIFYRRADSEAPKSSHVLLAPCPEPESLRHVLSAALGVRCVVEKRREIYFHENTKIHIDEVPDLGSFVEVEVIADHDKADVEAMHVTCAEWMRLLGVNESDLISASYSDMLGPTHTSGTP